MAKDKLMHLAFGAAAAVGSTLVVLVANTFGLAAGAVLSGALVGGGYEVVQLVRGDGAPSVPDALAVVVGAVAVAALIHFLT